MGRESRDDPDEPLEDAEVELERQRTLNALNDAGLVEDAANDDGLVFPLPDGAVIREIVARYDTRTSGRKVACAVCPQHQRHFRGFRVELESGDHVRMGIVCGENEFGEDAWARANADFNRRVQLATYQARVAPTLGVINAVEPFIHEWHQRTNKLARWLGEFRRELPALFTEIAKVAQHRSGRFEIERVRGREGVNAVGQRFTFKKAETSVVGRIPFPAMFVGETPTYGLNGAELSFREAKTILDERTDAPSLARAFREVQRARQYLIDADRAHQGALLNLNPSWLESLCEWANQYHALTARYWVEGSTICHTEAAGKGVFQLMERSQLGRSNWESILEAWE